MLGDDDKIVFYDGESPHSKHLLTVCNDCEDYTVISSTGKYLSVHLSTDKPGPSAFSFRYKQGESTVLLLAQLFSKKRLRFCHSPGILSSGVVVRRHAKTLTFSNISVITEDIYLKLRVVIHYQKGNPHQ